MIAGCVAAAAVTIAGNGPAQAVAVPVVVGGSGAFEGSIAYVPGEEMNPLSLCSTTSWTLSGVSANLIVDVASNEVAVVADISIGVTGYCLLSGVGAAYYHVSINGVGPLGTLSCNAGGRGYLVTTTYVGALLGGGCYFNLDYAPVAVELEGQQVPTATQGGVVTQAVSTGALQMRTYVCDIDCPCPPELCPGPVQSGG